jgi:hypothetical protein
VYPSIERIRAQLVRQVKAPLAVIAKRTQWAFDEDSEAWCDIDVRDLAADTFLLVVVAGGDARRDDFMARVWHRYCPEIWIVDPDARSISVRIRDDPPYVAATLIGPSKLNTVTIDTRELFSDD